MENFTPVSRELTNSSLWRSLADKEVKILIDLMALAPFKATSYNLYGVDIQLEKHELCFSCVKMAEKYKVTDHFLRRFFDKLAKHKILVKKKRKIDPSNSQTVCQTVSRTVSRTGSNSASPQFYTSITFCGWVFGENSIERYRTQVNDQKIEPSVEPSVEPFVAHNKEVIKEEEKKEENINIYNAREKKKFSNQEGVKHWVSVDRIKRLDFPHADEIMKSWIKYCSKRKELVMEELEKYCDLQICLQQTEMTLPVFDYRFRGVLKRAFDVKECKKEEDKPYLNYLD